METYHGHVRSPADAIILFEACRLGLLPRVQRRLSEKERQNIKSGSIFVWDEREAGMRRWTDGKSWSASRVSGSFLTYREMEGKRGGNAFAPPVTTLSVGGRGGKSPNPDSDSDGVDVEGPDGYRYKPDGLMKQSFSITTATHQKLHLISYYARSHPSSQNLQQPTNDPALKHIRPAKGMYPESTVHEQQNVPVVARGPMIATNFPISSPIAAYVPRQGATHPHSYSGSNYGWPPSPVSTPPTNLPPVLSQYQPQLPPPNNVATSMAYNPPLLSSSNGLSSSAMQIDRNPLPLIENLPQQSQHRGSMPSPLMQLRSSPRLAQSQALVRQQSAPPMSLPAPSTTQNERYTSPANSVASGQRSPPRTDKWDINPLRQSPGAMDQAGSPGRSGLEVQDIPSEKLGFGEDMRALRVLDRAFAA
ncbi:Gluconate transport-inducing protein [Rhizina undulata]